MLGGRGSNHADVFDTSTHTWTQGSTNSQQMHHFQAVDGPNGCAWAAGAWQGGYPDETIIPEIWQYCPQNDSWSVVATIRRPRGSGGAVFYNGLLYLVSGNVGGHNPDAKLVPWFDAYDPSTGTWTQLPDVPHRKLQQFLGFQRTYFYHSFHRPWLTHKIFSQNYANVMSGPHPVLHTYSERPFPRRSPR